MSSEEFWNGYSFLDALLGIFFLFFGGFTSLKFKKTSGNYPFWVVGVLGLGHMLMTILGIFYIYSFGGDSLSYWNLTADVSQEAESWMEYWGYNTFFIQWLNFLPAKVLGLHYVTGCLIYSLLSYQGFLWLLSASQPFYLKIKESIAWMSTAFLLLFFLPSFHFWTGIVGKEALLWFLIMGVLRYYLKKEWLLFFFFAFLSVWIRPVAGLVILGFYILHFLIWGDLTNRGKVIFGMAGIAFFVIGFWLLAYITGISQFSLEMVRKFSEGQYLFLSGFHASSELPVQMMSLGEILFAVAFRPFPGEIPTLWGFFSGIENVIIFLLAFGILFLVSFQSNKKGQLGFWLLVLGSVLIYLLSIALSVNVLGIMIRLKILFMPFLMWAGFHGWFLFFYQIKRSRVKASS